MTLDYFKESTERILQKIKNGSSSKVPSRFKCVLNNGRNLTCFVITNKMIQDKKTIQLLAKWRDRSNIWFPAQFPVTFKGTKEWAREQLLEKKDRILFFLQIEGQKFPFGHVGLYRFNYSKRACEIDNVIRGKHGKSSKGAMTTGLQLLIEWAFIYLRMNDLYLQVFSDNQKAILLYKRLGFEEISKIPLVSVKENGVTRWIESKNAKKSNFRYFVKMHLSKTQKK